MVIIQYGRDKKYVTTEDRRILFSSIYGIYVMKRNSCYDADSTYEEYGDNYGKYIIL